jgi:hypothetical protein
MPVFERTRVKQNAPTHFRERTRERNTRNATCGTHTRTQHAERNTRTRTQHAERTRGTQHKQKQYKHTRNATNTHAERNEHTRGTNEHTRGTNKNINAERTRGTQRTHTRYEQAFAKHSLYNGKAYAYKTWEMIKYVCPPTNMFALPPHTPSNIILEIHNNPPP